MLSIIIPTLNEEKFLPLLLEQIKKQDFSDYEVIVADAGSSDRTVQIAREYKHRVIKGGSVAYGRNQGAKTARGELLLFIDADNIYLPDDFLSELVGQFTEKNCDIASFPLYIDGNRMDKVAYKVYNWWAKKLQNIKAYATNSMIVKKKVFDQVGGFDESITIAEDHDFARRASKIGKFRYIEIDPIFVSARRMEKEGRIRIYSKYILAEIYMEAFGPIKKDIFRYWKKETERKTEKIGTRRRGA
ncbi:MAG TPA: glycosyltransferase [Candidatus Paceibacterota bacterium]|nr:glycosyltransferase [Candidatus Pacearchaeota archaeon]HRZ50694.1 glycosyltransferase [Candidatus Paceibacterota bacterium]HSA36409.1 glycosyltransferase [Candidatus Paceibacterota bacterium]